MNLFSLPVTHQLTPYLSQRQMGELPLLVLAHPRFQAAMALQGAQLIAWQPTGEKPVIWLSEKTAWQNGKAIRGGVPICWPWFGAAGNPSHGFARTLPWQLVAHDENAQNVTLTLQLESSDATKKIWPHDFTLYARFRLGEQCEFELEAHGEFSATGALHSYFAVDDIDQVSVSGLGNAFIDKVAGGTRCHSEQGRQVYQQQTDRIYTAPEATSLIEDKAGQRLISISHHHQSDVVTWNPGAEQSCSMGDMANDGYKTMVCVETARISQPMISAADHPGLLATTISVSRPR